MIEKIKKKEIKFISGKITFYGLFSSGRRILKQHEVGIFIFRSEISASGRLTGFTPKHIFLCFCRNFFLNQKYRKTNQIFVFSIQFYLRKSSHDNYLRLINALYRRINKMFFRRKTRENINEAVSKITD